MSKTSNRKPKQSDDPPNDELHFKLDGTLDFKYQVCKKYLEKHPKCPHSLKDIPRNLDGSFNKGSAAYREFCKLQEIKAAQKKRMGIMDQTPEIPYDMSKWGSKKLEETRENRNMILMQRSQLQNKEILSKLYEIQEEKTRQRMDVQVENSNKLMDFKDINGYMIIVVLV